MFLYAFNVHIHASLNSAPGELRPGPLAVSYDAAAEILATLPRMFLEPDGSFVWTGESPQGAWQVDGLLVDQGRSLAHVEAAGTCPANEFDQLLAALGWPAAPLVF
ncbi:MAG: hypothetical protein KDA41_03430, partial [Planctomycetales bacterium]|nr:hypothetical protein [Planctomycetales bacterium]